jgi:hypothetical protein
MTITTTPPVTAAAGEEAGDYDRQLIADALRLAGLASHEDRVAYLTSHGAPVSPLDGYAIVRAAVMGSMQHALAVLARGYERELKATAPAAVHEGPVGGMRTPWSPARGRHAASRVPQAAPPAAARERPGHVTIITSREGKAAEIAASRQRGNGETA